MINISKELLSEVIGYKPFKIDKIEQVNGVGLTLVLLNQDGTVRSYQNVYELAHKCKEWANKQGYKKVYSGIYESTDQGSLYICIISLKEGYNTLDFWEDTEVEAIFKACEWILDNKEKQ